MQHTEKKTKTVIKVSWCKLFYINNITLQRKKDKYFNAAREKENKSFPGSCEISVPFLCTFPCSLGEASKGTFRWERERQLLEAHPPWGFQCRKQTSTPKCNDVTLPLEPLLSGPLLDYVTGFSIETLLPALWHTSSCRGNRQASVGNARIPPIYD